MLHCRSEGLATLFAEPEDAPEAVTRDLGEPVTEAPGYGVKQKGGTNIKNIRYRGS